MQKVSSNVTHEGARRILLGVTGGIAAYKSAELVRELIKAGHSVQVVMTKAAQHFITPTTMQALSGKPVWTDLWDAREVEGKANAMPHIELARAVDLILVAPATADFMAKLATGLADDLLTTLCAARNRDRCQLMIAPAMNIEMWRNPATQRNAAQIAADGAIILGPDEGEQACGETGAGRMLEASALAASIVGSLGEKGTLAGKHVLVTAGPTFEAIDPVRGITNHSSGKMGYALAQAAAESGARVTLVSGPTSLPVPGVNRLIKIVSASELFEVVRDNIEDVNVFFSVAAVADYTPKSPSAQKIKKKDQGLMLELEPTQDVLAYVAALPNPPYCVGFAAESENVVENAVKKRQTKGIPLIIANLAQDAIGSDMNEVVLIDADGPKPLPKAAKIVVARDIIDFVARAITTPRALRAIRHS